MDNKFKNTIPVIALLTVFIIPLFIDNRLINVNILHRFLFSAITIILCIILCQYSIKSSIFKQFRIILILEAAFLFFLLISAEVNDRLVLALEDFALYLNVFIFSYLLFLSFQLYDFKKLLTYISFLVTLVCLIISALGILEFFNINLLNFQANTRPGSTLGIRNFASEYAVIALPFSLIFILNNSKIAYKIFYSFSSLIILVFIFFCRTRSSFVVLFLYIVLLTIFILYRKYYFEENLFKGYFIVVTLFLVAFLIGLYSAPNIDKERKNLNNTITSIFDKNLPENSARINYWRTAKKMFFEDPIIGVGTGSWFGIYPYYNGNIYNDENVLRTSELNPHNDYFEVLCENGIFGFSLFMLLLTAVGIKLFIETKKSVLTLPVFLSYCGFLSVSVFSFPKDNVSIMILFSIHIGVSLFVNKYDIKREEISEDRKIFKVISLAAFSTALVAVIIFNYIRYDSEITYLNALKDKGSGNYKAMLEKFEYINNLFYPVDANKMPVDYYKGVGQFELKNYYEAMNSFKGAQELAPYVPAIKSNIASSFYMLKDNDNAIKLLTEMKREYPFFIEPQINLLAIYTNMGQDSLAMDLLNYISQRQLDSNFIRNYFVLEKIKVYYNEKNLR